jgi:hypothetical protein
MSVGVNLLMALVRRVAGILGPDYDIEIVEHAAISRCRRDGADLGAGGRGRRGVTDSVAAQDAMDSQDRAGASISDRCCGVGTWSAIAQWFSRDRPAHRLAPRGGRELMPAAPSARSVGTRQGARFPQHGGRAGPGSWIAYRPRVRPTAPTPTRMQASARHRPARHSERTVTASGRRWRE